MNTRHYSMTALHPENVVVAAAAAAPRPILHRLRSVRQREGISLRNVAHHLHASHDEVRAQEVETADLPLSVLHQWAVALKVPVTELVAEPTTELSLPLLDRARLLRTMKTVQAILEVSSQARVKRLGEMLVEQLVEIMPELSGVTAWNSSGYHRRRCDLGRAADFAIPYQLQLEDRAGT